MKWDVEDYLNLVEALFRLMLGVTLLWCVSAVCVLLVEKPLGPIGVVIVLLIIFWAAWPSLTKFVRETKKGGF